MARIRCIKPEFWRHPVLGRLPDDQQLLALALLSMADDEGYFRAEPELIRGDVQPFREDLATISRGLAKLSEVGWIEILNHVEQGSIGRVKKWDEHQRVDHPKSSKLKKYFIREDVANPSRSSREDIALEQGSGNRDQGTGIASKQITPEGLSQIEYAKRLLEDLGLPAVGNLILVADAISADSKKHGVTKAESFDFIRQQALTDQEAGVQINRFYFTDAKFRGKEGRNGKPSIGQIVEREQAILRARRAQ
jgi:hypothetical protein